MSAEPSIHRWGRHDADVVSLVFGALFVAAAAFYGLIEQGKDAGRIGDWYLPILLIGVGALGLLASLKVRRSPDEPAG
ncbi:MAG: hypothetical protein H0T85_07985 [Geodermatophilaceae bacterium]|nr:hypothetical protein [Geodermatophilaceae bacterium]